MYVNVGVSFLPHTRGSTKEVRGELLLVLIGIQVLFGIVGKKP